MTAPSTVHIHADESCLGNQFKSRANPGGAAGLVETWYEGAWVRRDFWISDADTTNNQMALQSALVGLALLTRPCRVRFVSDSQYLVKGISEWVHGWKRRGWKRKGGSIENLELWKALDSIVDRHAITWEWVRGHAGHPKNEYANAMAIRAATEQTDSGGLIVSAFEEWLLEERDEGRYLDYDEFAKAQDSS